MHFCDISDAVTFVIIVAKNTKTLHVSGKAQNKQVKNVRAF